VVLGLNRHPGGCHPGPSPSLITPPRHLGEAARASRSRPRGARAWTVTARNSRPSLAEGGENLVGVRPPAPSLGVTVHLARRQLHWARAQWAVAHSCNPSNSGGRDQEDRSSNPARAKSSRPRLKDTQHKKKAGGMAHGGGSEFKPQRHRKGKRVRVVTNLLSPCVLPHNGTLTRY
jgi:hypothetical protein